MSALALLVILVGMCQGQGGEGQPCPCQGGHSCHPTLAVCYRDAKPVTEPYTWIGDPPDCQVNRTHCDYFELEYESSHLRGDIGSSWCITGTKVRCVSTNPPPNTIITAANTIKIVSYNIYERRSLISHDGQRERTCRIPKFLLRRYPDLDVGIFNEAFMGGCWPDDLDLRTLMRQYGLPYFTKTIDDIDEIDGDKFENGGVFIASRWPIIKSAKHIYTSVLPGTRHSFAAMGAMYAHVNKTVNGTSKQYHIFGTHTASSGNMAAQAAEMYQFMNSQNISKSDPVMYGGDMNVDYHRTNISQPLIQALNATVPPITSESEIFTFDVDNNDVLNTTSSGGASRQWLDYVMYSNQHQQPSDAQLQCFLATSSSPMPVCWCHNCINFDDYIFPFSEDCDDTRYFTHLSDHHPVIGTFVF